MKPTTWHGLTYSQWLRMWNASDFVATMTRTLYEIAECSWAKPADRLMALQTINEAVIEGALPAQPDLPRVMTDLFLEIAAHGDQRPLLFGNRRQNRVSARLAGARWMLGTSYQLLAGAERSRAVAAGEGGAVPTPAIDKLLS